MIPAMLFALAALAAILQVGALPAAFAQPLAAPILPVALLAGWAAVRRPGETWTVPPAAAVVLGAVSEVRVGLFLLALLPALTLATLARSRGRLDAPFARRTLLAAGIGALGATAYVATLSLGSGPGRLLMETGAAVAASAAWTGALAALLAAALWRVRARGTGLFT